MKSGKSIPGFLILFFGVYVLLMMPWPGLRTAYRDKLVGGANVVYSIAPKCDGMKALPFDKPGHKDTVVLRPDTLYIGVNTGEVGYLPTALLLSLIVATPVSWKRRLIGLIGGFVLVNGFILMRFVVLALHLSSMAIPGPDAAPRHQ